MGWVGLGWAEKVYDAGDVGSMGEAARGIADAMARGLMGYMNRGWNQKM